MTKSAYEIRQKAWKKLSGNWGAFALAWFIFFLLTCLGSPTFGLVGLALLPMQYALYAATLRLMRGDRAIKIEDLFTVYSNNGLRAFLVMFLVGLFTALWCLLFFIPGIIMNYAYAMAPYIMNDDPEISAMDAIRKSKEMMRGHKWDLFCLDLSFIGWFLLAICTLGIAMFWVAPYCMSARAEFYRELKGENEVETVEAEVA